MIKCLTALLLALNTADAFVPTIPKVDGSRVSSPAVSRNQKLEMMADPITLTKTAASLPALYGLMSINEYITHRYYQHTDFNKSPQLQKIAQTMLRTNEPIKIKGGGHVEHHAETLDDMTLKSDDRWKASPAAKLLDSDPYRGTAFSWVVTGLMYIQMFVTSVPVLKILGFSLLGTFLMVAAGILLHALVWNTLHPDMHGLPPVPAKWGFPSEWFSFLRSSRYFKWLYQNHQGHHVMGGQVNYNVCCPGVDHVLGTYVKEEEWKPLMRTSPAASAN